MTNSSLRRELLSLAQAAGYVPDAINQRLDAGVMESGADRRCIDAIAGGSVDLLAGGGKVAVADVLREANRRNVHPDAIPSLLERYAAELRASGRDQWAAQVGILTGKEDGTDHNGHAFYRDGARLYGETDQPNVSAVSFRDAIADTLGRGVTIHEPGCGKRPKDLSYYLSDPAITAGRGYEICLPAAITARGYVAQKDLSHRVQIHAGRLRDVFATHPEAFTGDPAATVHCSVTHFASEHDLHADLVAESQVADVICDARKHFASPWNNGGLLLQRFSSGGHRLLPARDNVPRTFLHRDFWADLYKSLLAPRGFDLIHDQNRSVGIYDDPDCAESMDEVILARRRGKAWRR